MHIMDLANEPEELTGAGILNGAIKAVSSAVGLGAAAIGIPAWINVLFF